MMKNESCWPVHFNLVSEQVEVGRWMTDRWLVDQLSFPLDGQSMTTHQFVLPLELFLDERTDYRFNLSSRAPKLFFVFEVDDEALHPIKVTVSQTAAASYMDGDFVVMSEPLPAKVQAWMEAYIGRHGELLETRKKKRKGAGRASGN